MISVRVYECNNNNNDINAMYDDDDPSMESFYSARSSLGDSIQPFVDQVLDEIEILAPGTLQSLRDTQEIKVAGREGEFLFAKRMVCAEKFNISKATSRAVEHASWRRENIPQGLPGLDEGEIEDQINDEKVYVQLETRSRRPCLIVRVKEHTAGLSDASVLKKFVIYCLEIATYLCDVDKYENPDCMIDVVFDARSMKWKNYDTHGLIQVFAVLVKAFPERVHKIYMFQGPKLLDMLWKVVKPFVDPVSREKVVFLNGSNGRDVLYDAIGHEFVPKDFLGIPIRECKDIVMKMWPIA